MKIYSFGIVSITAVLLLGCTVSADPNNKKKKHYDYIIVGGGAAGCIEARKLSDNRRNSALLLEAGGNYIDDPVILDPNWFPHAGELLVDSKYIINYLLFFPPLSTATYSE